METRGNKKYSRLILLINDGWAKTMRFVVKKVAQDNNLNNIDPWGLDEFLDDNMQLLKTELNKQPSKIRRMLSKPTDIEQWDVTLICLVLLEVCVPKLKTHFTRLDSDVKLIRSTRNDIVHSGRPTIADDAYRAKFDQVKTVIREGLKYINNTDFNREMETFIEDVETGIIGSDRTEAVYREWYESDKHLEDKLETLDEKMVKMTQDIAVLLEAYKQKIEPETTIVMTVESNDKSSQRNAEAVLETALNSDVTTTRDVDEQYKMVQRELDQMIKDKPQAEKERLVKALVGFVNQFQDDGKTILETNTKCVLLKIKCPSFQSLCRLWKDCVNDVITELLRPVQAAFRMIDRYHDVVIKAVVRESEFWRCMDIIVSEVSEAASKTWEMRFKNQFGLSPLESESAARGQAQIRATADGEGRIQMKIKPRSVENLLHIWDICKSGKLNENLEQVAEAMKLILETKHLSIKVKLDERQLLSTSPRGEMEKKMQEKYLTADEYTTARYRQTGFIAHRAYDRHKMQIATLAEQSQQTVNILSKEDELRNEIASHYPRLNEDIRRLKEKRIIVIAGDPGSGKKSIVNLLMGAPLLPLGNTRSPVGIIKLQKGALSVHPQYGISITPKDPMISQDKTKAAMFVREALSGLTNVSNATETTVCWPLESDILQDDVEIVVESGISDESDILVKYLPKATAFLYIVDSGHSKGIQTEKLKSILRLQQIYCEKYRLQKLKAKRALFLFNKWDQVSCLLENFSDDAKRMKEVDDTVWSNSKTTLQTIWNDIKPEQMMKVSVWQETGLISPCIGIEPHQTERVLAIVYDSFAQCEDTARIWLKDFGCFMSTMITRRIDTAYGIKQKSEELMFVFVKKYEEASHMTKYLVNDVQSEVDRKSRTLSKEVANYIGSPDVRQKMNDWSYGEFPCSLVWESRHTIKEEVAKAAFRRLSSIILSGEKKEFTEFTDGLQLYVKSKTEAIVKLLKDMDSMQLSSIDMDKSVYKIYHLDLSRYYNWSSRLNSIINEALLTKIFGSQFLFMLLFVALPFFFLVGALTGRTPHTMIMQRTSNDIIDELDSDKICSAVRDQLVDLKTEIRNLAETDFPPMLKSMAEKKDMFTDISKKASSNFDAIVGLKSRVESFCSGCLSL